MWVSAWLWLAWVSCRATVPGWVCDGGGCPAGAGGGGCPVGSVGRGQRGCGASVRSCGRPGPDGRGCPASTAGRVVGRVLLPGQPGHPVETAAGIVDRGGVPEIPAVLGELERTGKLEEAGGVATVLGLLSHRATWVGLLVGRPGWLASAASGGSRQSGPGLTTKTGLDQGVNTTGSTPTGR